MHRLLHVLVPLLALTSAPAAQHWFTAPLRPLADQQGTLLHHGDLDGDGDEDLVSGAGTKVFVFLNGGSGDFLLAHEIDFGPGADPLVGALLDIDGDGWLDLAHAAPAGVGISRGLGSGAFAAPVAATWTGGAPYRMDPGQADAEPALELAIVGGFADLEVAWIDWSGGAPVVQPAAQISTDGTTGLGTIAVLELDGDGDEDVVFASSTTFQPLLTTAGLALHPGHTVPSGFGTGNTPLLEAGDLDGDGDEDILAFGQSSFVVHENLLPGLSAGPSKSMGLIFLDLHQPAHLGDWDGDGDLDIALSQGFSIFGDPAKLRLMENQGGFSFAQKVEEDGVKIGAGAGFADFDGDGHLDLAATAVVFFGDGAFGGYFGSELDGPYFAPSVPVAVADFEGDGDVDLVGAGSTLLNDGGGHFQPSAPQWPAPEPGHAYSGVAAYADFDGDAREDYLVGYVQLSTSVSKGTRLLGADGIGAFKDMGLASPVGLSAGMRAVGDLDQDGDLDLLAGADAWLNDGHGHFPTTAPAPSGEFVLVHDTDLDGDDDVIVKSADKLTVFHQVAPLSFAGTDVASFAPAPGELHLLDLDGDGLLDLARTALQYGFFSIGGSTLHLMRGNGTAFDAPVTLPYQSYFQQTLAAEDVDGDGVLDLMAGSQQSSSAGSVALLALLVYPGLGGPLAYGAPRNYYTRQITGFADLDEDGDTDAIGDSAIANHRVHGAAGGEIRQYGKGFPGWYEVVPVLGADGPPTSTNPAAQVRLVSAAGFGPAWLVFGFSEAALVGQPLAGMTLLVGGPLGIIPHVPLSGLVGVPAAGKLALPLPKIPALFGLSVFHQAFVLDAGALLGWSASNGLEIRFGP
jgi:hypothetical protein